MKAKKKPLPCPYCPEVFAGTMPLKRHLDECDRRLGRGKKQ